MTEYSIEIENLSKRYSYHRHSKSAMLRESISHAARSLFSRKKKNAAKKDDGFWALEDISLQILRGESIGLIGNNGAGKSTLLKILSRLTHPTSGRAVIRGRVGALLEVGMGFHQELSGRDNVFLNGALLGMKRVEILSKFHEIVAFAGIESFIDTPVKHYSSGMYMRLAFSVAAHLETDILLVDEVLSVGDASFQKQCLGKMHDLSQEGRTVIFVSHHMRPIVSLTERCVLLEKGHIKMIGPSQDVVDAYMSHQITENIHYQKEMKSEKPSITHIQIETSRPGNIQHVNEGCQISVTLCTPEATNNTALVIHIVNNHGQSVAHFVYLDSETPFCREPGRAHIVCDVPKLRLYLGQYTLRVTWVDVAFRKNIDCVENVCGFEVVSYELRDYAWKKESCVYVEENHWKVESQVESRYKLGT